MPKVNYINAIVCGHLLVTWAIFLNLYDFNKAGVALALVSLAGCYFLENFRAVNVVSGKVTQALELAMVVSLASSYFCWLL